MQNTKQKSGTKQKLTIAAIFGAMGPGLLAALSGNDAGGIATYSSAGASYGYKMLWMLPVMTVLLIVTQETAARCGCVTGKGLASLIRERFGVRKSVLAMAALLIANTAVTISEFAGIASGLALFGVPASISVPLVALAGLVWKFPFVLVFAMTAVEELAKFTYGMIYLNSGKWIKPVTAPQSLPVAAEETFPAEDQAV